MSTGYANRIIHLKFPELVDPKLDKDGNPIQAKDADGELKFDKDGNPEWEPSELIWLSMKNPRLIPPAEIQPKDVAVDENGEALNPDDALTSLFTVYSKVIIGWRAYDASNYEIDPETGEPLDQELIPLPVTLEGVRKLPAQIIGRIIETMAEYQNPNR